MISSPSPVAVTTSPTLLVDASYNGPNKPMTALIKAEDDVLLGNALDQNFPLAAGESVQLPLALDFLYAKAASGTATVHVLTVG